MQSGSYQFAVLPRSIWNTDMHNSSGTKHMNRLEEQIPQLEGLSSMYVSDMPTIPCSYISHIIHCALLENSYRMSTIPEFHGSRINANCKEIITWARSKCATTYSIESLCIIISEGQELVFLHHMSFLADVYAVEKLTDILSVYLGRLLDQGSCETKK